MHCKALSDSSTSPINMFLRTKILLFSIIPSCAIKDHTTSFILLGRKLYNTVLPKKGTIMSPGGTSTLPNNK